MTKRMWSGAESRKIRIRIVVEGDLTLLTPAHLGSGDGDDLTDMPLLVDPSDGKRPLLTGASIAGALRSYLRERESGYGAPAGEGSVRLFGGVKGDDDGLQSNLIVEDALGKHESYGIEMREGVAVAPASRTAAAKKLYDAQLWRAGTTFPLRFELIVNEDDDETDLKRALASALAGLSDGSITLGMRKRRGYGQVQVNGWRVKTYNLRDSKGLCDWLEHGAARMNDETPGVAKTLVDEKDLLADRRASFEIDATFALDGSLLIRSGGGADDTGPDMVHLHSYRPDYGRAMPIASGTSLAGALRARAFKIVHTLGTREQARALVSEMFGPEMKHGDKPHASRVWVAEAVIDHALTDRVQSRVSIDRFTGGAREGALFNEQPAFGGSGVELKVKIRLANPAPHEIGLLLLLLKDLWTGDLPLGGESSIGRGRLQGRWARLTHARGGDDQEKWVIEPQGERLRITGNRGTLDDYVRVDLAKRLGLTPQEVTP